MTGQSLVHLIKRHDWLILAIMVVSIIAGVVAYVIADPYGVAMIIVVVVLVWLGFATH